MEEKRHKRIREQKHSSIWILVIVIIIAILTITSIFIDNKKFENSVNEKKKLEQEIENLKKENAINFPNKFSSRWEEIKELALTNLWQNIQKRNK